MVGSTEVRYQVRHCERCTRHGRWWWETKHVHQDKPWQHREPYDGPLGEDWMKITMNYYGWFVQVWERKTEKWWECEVQHDVGE